MYLQPDPGDLMAVEMIDLRTKVPAECHAVLTGISQATGEDIASIARQALTEFATRQRHIAMMVVAVTRREGCDGAEQGGPRA